MRCNPPQGSLSLSLSLSFSETCMRRRDVHMNVKELRAIQREILVWVDHVLAVVFYEYHQNG